MDNQLGHTSYSRTLTDPFLFPASGVYSRRFALSLDYHASFTPCTRRPVWVFLRYVLNKSAVGIIEINTLLLPPVVFLLLAETQRRRGHVRVTLLTMRLSSRVQSVIETYGFVLGLAFMVVFGWQTWKEFTYSYGINQVLYGIMPIPVWWSKLCLPIACWLLCLQYVKDLVSNIGQLRLKE